MALEDAYRQALPASRALFERAQHVFPDGVTHDNRRMQPFPIFVERADGAYKWDVDGRQYIDYWMGHGALIMGHNPPHVRDAVIEQAARGTHYGASHPLEVSWAEWICKLVPCAESVRFTASGTEATHMALRLARAYTGKAARHQIRRALPRLARGAGSGRADTLRDRTRARTDARSGGRSSAVLTQ